MAATVDEIGQGRLVFGVGAGWNETEFRAFGLPFDHRVDRFEEAFTIVRRLLAGERVTQQGTYWRAEDAVLLPPLPRKPPLMVGSTGERVLAITLPHVQVWNTWYDLYGNSTEGFERESAKVTAAAERAGRDPSEIERSACVLVVLDRITGERPVPEDYAPVEGGPTAVAAHLRELAAAGADEAILVASPITEGSVRELGTALALLDA
jgi:alkanesulfonate monooxygenase SsuD/methylene tetrahydromethanopterin reductase-like flavin-dependent oxidoreductase (luciferase family)